MHWGHATSTDLIHWKEESIALYPDANGAMFSGSIVADVNNTTGLFDQGKGGLVALITADGGGQRIELAYSKDEGKTWNKLADPVLDYANDDPLHNAAFRDPKVFRWNNQWFMVVAGGPLRIYSSSDLQNWKSESVYSGIETECPDLYPIQTDNGVKWVLSRGGRYYKVGDFKQVDGNWYFLPDKAYEKTDGIMNFGKDSYAAMTYFVQDFGTEANPTLPEIIESNWMNNWDYCNDVAATVGQKFNGTYNLNLKLGLTKEGDKYVLTQTPITAYQDLRDVEHAMTFKHVTVGEDNDLLKDFQGDTYEIVAHFVPVVGTKKLGFNVRTSATQGTSIVYDLEEETMSIDRSKSGKQINAKFTEPNIQNKVTKNADGSVDLHIYVDKASVEVFTKGDTVLGANQIFPDADSLGVSLMVEGDPVVADIAIYPLKSIWFADKPVVTPKDDASSSAINDTVNAGEGNVTNVDANISDVNTAANGKNNTVAISNAGDITSEIKVGNNTIILPNSKTKVTLQETEGQSSSVKVQTSKVSVAKQLPQTGEEKTNVWMGVMAALLGALSFLFPAMKRRKGNN